MYFLGFFCIVLAVFVRIPTPLADAFLRHVYPVSQAVTATFTNALPFPLFESFHILGLLIVVPLIGWALLIPRERLLKRGAPPAALVAGVLIWIYATVYMVVAARCVYARTPLPVLVHDRFTAYDRADLTELEHDAAIETARLAPIAHNAYAFESEAQEDAQLHADVARTLGHFGVSLAVVPRPKVSRDELQNEQAGIDGESAIGTSEIVISDDLLWQDRPFVLAHEAGHVAGFGRESDANTIAALACTSSPDPVIAYSGWLQILRDSLTYFNPSNPGPRLSAIVRADLRRSTAVTSSIMVAESNIKWQQGYDKHLRYENVPGGIANYEGYLPDIMGHPTLKRMLIGTP